MVPVFQINVHSRLCKQHFLYKEDSKRPYIITSPSLTTIKRLQNSSGGFLLGDKKCNVLTICFHQVYRKHWQPLLLYNRNAILN